MHMRVVSTGLSGEYTDQYNHNPSLAREHFNVATAQPGWLRVTLSVWIDGVGTWKVVKHWEGK